MDIEVKHDEKSQKFFADVEGKKPYLQYEVVNTNTLNMIHTYVPVELRGRGIAAKIVEEGLKYAQQNHYGVIPSCSYVEIYMERHPEFEELKK